MLYLCGIFSLVWRINGLNVFDTSLLNDFIFYAAQIHKKCSKMCIDMSNTFSFYQLTCDMCLWIDDCIFAQNKIFFTHIWQMNKIIGIYVTLWFDFPHSFYVNRHRALSILTRALVFSNDLFLLSVFHQLRKIAMRRMSCRYLSNSISLQQNLNCKLFRANRLVYEKIEKLSSSSFFWVIVRANINI